VGLSAEAIGARLGVDAQRLAGALQSLQDDMVLLKKADAAFVLF
jgi:hypothetical protein